MEPSLFDPREQQVNMDARIVYALERVSEAFRVLLWRETRSSGLSPIQAQLLIFLLYHSDDKNRVSYLAHEFNMTKATISEVVKTLVTKKLAVKQSDPKDSRSSMIRLTPKGEEIARRAALFAAQLRGPLTGMSEEQKENFFTSVMDFLHGLQKSGVLGMQRMCHSCNHFERRDSSDHFCRVYQVDMPGRNLRIDCSDHSPSRA